MDMTLQQAMQVAADLEERGCLNEPAKAARVLLAHINSLASPQVTDEQIVALRNEIGKEYGSVEEVTDVGIVAFARALLSAPPAAEMPEVPMLWWFNDDNGLPFASTPYAHEAAQWKANGRIVHCTKASPQEAKPVAAQSVTSHMMNEGADAMREGMAMLNSGRSYQSVCVKIYEAMLDAAPQEQAPADKDGSKVALDSFDSMFVDSNLSLRKLGQQNEPCKGVNCGTTTGQHSEECYAEHQACVDQGAAETNREAILGEAIEALERLNDSIVRRASNEDDGMLCCEQTSMHTMCSAVNAIRAIAAPPAPVSAEPVRDQTHQQLIHWLLTSPLDGQPFKFAGPPEKFVMGLSIVKMVDTDGKEWTLTAGLKEGYQSPEARADTFLKIAAEEEVENNDIENDWRRLALKFDNHRMQALAHLQMLLKEPIEHAGAVTEFLKEPPLAGETVLARRIEAIASASPSTDAKDSDLYKLPARKSESSGDIPDYFNEGRARGWNECIDAAISAKESP